MTPTTGNRLSTDGTWNFGYDNEGNETSKVNTATGETWVYGYNQRNQLVDVQHQPTATATVDMEVVFDNDAWGNRIEKEVLNPTGFGPQPGTMTLYAFDGWDPSKPTPTGNENFDVFLALNGDSTSKTRYLHDDETSGLLARIDISGGTQTAEWTLTDHLGSVRDVVNNSGTIVDAIQYGAFGIISAETSASNRGDFSYAAGWNVFEIGLIEFDARFLDVTTSRWLSQDPIGFTGGDSNLYRYVHNAANAKVDPSGNSELIRKGGGNRDLYYRASVLWVATYGPGADFYIGELSEDGRHVTRNHVTVPVELVQQEATYPFGFAPDWDDFFNRTAENMRNLPRNSAYGPPTTATPPIPPVSSSSQPMMGPTPTPPSTSNLTNNSMMGPPAPRDTSSTLPATGMTAPQTVSAPIGIAEQMNRELHHGEPVSGPPRDSLDDQYNFVQQGRQQDRREYQRWLDLNFPPEPSIGDPPVPAGLYWFGPNGMAWQLLDAAGAGYAGYRGLRNSMGGAGIAESPHYSGGFTAVNGPQFSEQYIGPARQITYQPEQPNAARPTVNALPSSGNLFVVTGTGTIVPVPAGASGPFPVINNNGSVTGVYFSGGSGGSGLHARVTTVRIMDPSLPNAASPGYPFGYAVYQNQSGQGVNPTTARTLPNADPLRHIPLR